MSVCLTFFDTTTQSWKCYIFNAICLCVYLSFNIISAKRIHRFECGFCLMAAYRIGLDPIEISDLSMKVNVTVMQSTWTNYCQKMRLNVKIEFSKRKQNNNFLWIIKNQDFIKIWTLHWRSHDISAKGHHSCNSRLLEKSELLPLRRQKTARFRIVWNVTLRRRERGKEKRRKRVFDRIMPFKSVMSLSLYFSQERSFLDIRTQEEIKNPCKNSSIPKITYNSFR